MCAGSLVRPLTVLLSPKCSWIWQCERSSWTLVCGQLCISVKTEFNSNVCCATRRWKRLGPCSPTCRNRSQFFKKKNSSVLVINGVGMTIHRKRIACESGNLRTIPVKRVLLQWFEFVSWWKNIPLSTISDRMRGQDQIFRFHVRKIVK